MDTQTIPQKRCSKKEQCCHPEQKNGGWLPSDAHHFHKDKSAKDGLSYSCKACAVLRACTWSKDNPEQKRTTNQKNHLKNRERRLVLMKDYRVTHREEHNAYRRRWYHANIEVRRAYNNALNRIRYAANPEKYRAKSRINQSMRRHADGEFTQEDVDMMLKTQKGRCWWCGKKLKQSIKYGKGSRVGFEVDHRIAINRGGTNELGNLCISCPSCNQSKGRKLPQEWNGRLL